VRNGNRQGESFTIRFNIAGRTSRGCCGLCSSPMLAQAFEAASGICTALACLLDFVSYLILMRNRLG